MRAALCRTLDGPSAITIESLADPTPKAGEVIVRVKAAALNFLDTLIVRGKYQYKPELPFSPSGEIAGVVEATGPGATRLRKGERVAGYIGWGGAREKVAAPESQLVAIPESVSDAAAAGVSITYGTAMHGLLDRAGVKAGETVAVLGAAGGAGLAAVEVAVMLGARVIAVASSEEKLAVCRAHGAEMTLNYKNDDLKQGLRDLTQGKGVDVIYDCVGGPHAEASLRSIAWGGRFLVVGFAAGEIPKIPLNLVLLKNCALVGVFWGEMALREPERQRVNLARILEGVAKGQLKPHIHTTLPLEETGRGIAMLSDRSVVGKVIVTP